MRFSCTNCLAPVDTPGMCAACERMVEDAHYAIGKDQALRKYRDWFDGQFDDIKVGDTIIVDTKNSGNVYIDNDPLWIAQLKERRIKGYARARRMAKHGN